MVGLHKSKKQNPSPVSVFLLSIPHFFPWTSLHVIKSLVMEQHCHLVALCDSNRLPIEGREDLQESSLIHYLTLFYLKMYISS